MPRFSSRPISYAAPLPFSCVWLHSRAFAFAPELMPRRQALLPTPSTSVACRDAWRWVNCQQRAKVGWLPGMDSNHGSRPDVSIRGGSSNLWVYSALSRGSWKPVAQPC